MLSAQHQPVGAHVTRIGRLLPPLRKVDLDRYRDATAPGDLILHVEKFIELEPEPVGPEPAFGCRVDQLEGDAQALPRPAKTSPRNNGHPNCRWTTSAGFVFRLKRKAECRAITMRLRNRLRLAMMSSEKPSQR